MLVSAIPFSTYAYADTTAEITSTLNSYKANVYRQNWYWCSGLDTSFSYSVCGSAGCMCNSFNGAYQCHGYALYLAYKMMGTFPSYRLWN